MTLSEVTKYGKLIGDKRNIVFVLNKVFGGSNYGCGKVDEKQRILSLYKINK